MTREDAQKIIEALVALRETATDADALNAAAIYPAWREGVEYAAGQRVRYDGVLYRVLQGHASQADWDPPTSPSLFAKILIPDADVIPEWEQPDSTNGYMTGDRVTHGGKTWISTVDNNSWEPGVFGWDEVNGEEE